MLYKKWIASRVGIMHEGPQRKNDEVIKGMVDKVKVLISKKEMSNLSVVLISKYEMSKLMAWPARHAGGPWWGHAPIHERNSHR